MVGVITTDSYNLAISSRSDAYGRAHLPPSLDKVGHVDRCTTDGRVHPRNQVVIVNESIAKSFGIFGQNSRTCVSGYILHASNFRYKATIAQDIAQIGCLPSLSSHSPWV